MVVRFPLRRWAALGLFTLVAIAALLPLRLALDLFGFDEHGLSARQVDGSIWIGELEDAAVGPVQLGNVSAELEFWRLFLGRARVAVESEAGIAKGAVEIGRNSLGVHDAEAALPLSAIAPGLPARAELRFSKFSAVFSDGRCERAEGAVTSNLLSIDPAFASGGTALTGTAKCEAGRLLLPLSGSTAAGDVSVAIRISGNGEYEFDMGFGSPEPALRARLTALGFTADGNRLRLHGTGRF
jgi:general secretion pathway protein N